MLAYVESIQCRDYRTNHKEEEKGRRDRLAVEVDLFINEIYTEVA